MAQASNFAPQYIQEYPVNQQQSHFNSGFVVVNQQPSRREVFPYRLQTNWILAFGIAKCVLGSLILIVGIGQVAAVKYDTKIGIAIWCGLTIIANGVIGCILKYAQTRCLIGAFLALSMTSLIFSISMLAFYSFVLEYFVNLIRNRCSYYFGCYEVMTSVAKNLGIGIASSLIALAVFELACSIGSVAVSCKAYSKFCNTCDVNDCCSYLGCCECDCIPLNAQQGAQPAATTYSNHQNIQMSSLQPPPYQPNQQRAQSNPCSDVVSFIINIPSYVFGTANGTQLSAINVNLQPVASNQQVPLTEQGRAVEQAQGVTSIAVGDTQPNSV